MIDCSIYTAFRLYPFVPCLSITCFDPPPHHNNFSFNDRFFFSHLQISDLRTSKCRSFEDLLLRSLSETKKKHFFSKEKFDRFSNQFERDSSYWYEVSMNRKSIESFQAYWRNDWDMWRINDCLLSTLHKAISSSWECCSRKYQIV
jgi:hypothetical protein